MLAAAGRQLKAQQPAVQVALAVAVVRAQAAATTLALQELHIQEAVVAVATIKLLTPAVALAVQELSLSDIRWLKGDKMSHWAEIDENNTVIRVLVGDNRDADEGEAFMKSLGGTWVKTSYNAKIRKHFAGIGYTYRYDIDAFVPPQCHDSAVLDADTATWTCTDPSHTIILGE